MSLPTLYEYYTDGGINSGLIAEGNEFRLNGKGISVYSGAVHYFRVPKPYWRDRLRKLRAAGLNAVETYVPWNLHEPQEGYFDFGAGGSDFQEFLNISEFLKIAQEEDLFAIVRPGPYICAEWDFGGMPSWLLRSNAKLRTSDPKFLKPVKKYFSVLLNILAALQFMNGGPIIAFQIENEYGNVKKPNEDIDETYLNELKNLYNDNNLTDLFFTSDTPSNGNFGSIPNTLYTANFQNDTIKELDLLKRYQPDRPAMVMEFWTGWFDHWGETHHTVSNLQFSKNLQLILDYPSSVNFYMFHGGTNWGFLNGGNILDSSTDNGGLALDTSSYDYDAPLSEAGDYTDKYHTIKKLLAIKNKVLTRIPEMPTISCKIAHKEVKVEKVLKLSDFNLPSFTSNKLIPMEYLNINNNSGQSYGYVIYKKVLDIKPNSILKVEGRVCDTLMVLVNGKLISSPIRSLKDLEGFGYWKAKDASLNLGGEGFVGGVLELVVENWGRNNFGKLDQFDQRKGLWQGDVLLNGEVLNDWEISPLEFKKSWNKDLAKSGNWKGFEEVSGPALYRFKLIVNDLFDSFLDMEGWNKGVVVVNGFVLSRFFGIGPQQTAYLPAAFLKKGENEILVFEHFKGRNILKFSDKPIYKTKNNL